MAHAGFSKGGGGAGNVSIIKTKKNSPLRISPFFCPKLGGNQKKRPSIRFCPFLRSNFLPKLQRGGGGGHAAILRAILC